MNSFSAEERLALRQSIHLQLGQGSDERAVRASMETPSGYDPELWQELAEMGVVGLIVDEAHGGAGVGTTIPFRDVRTSSG
jgi:acyl-CoA dehydrogenase